jgi:hypothetical protein
LSCGYVYGGEIIRLTNNNLNDFAPRVNGQGKVWWQQQRLDPDGIGRTYIMQYNGAEVITISEFNEAGTLWHGQSSIDGNSIVYAKGVPTEIYLFDGTNEIQITSNNYNDVEPYICNGYIVWYAQPPYNPGSHPNEIFLYKPDQPTAVQMSSLKATPANKAIKLNWQTETETDAAGFNVWRAEGFKKVNESLISAEGSPVIGADYDFFDQWVLNGKRYFYLLEDIDTQGISTFHGPVKAVPRRWYGIGK